MYLLEIIIFSLYHVIAGPTKIIKDLLKDHEIQIFRFIFRVIFSVKNQWNLSQFFSMKNIGQGDHFFEIFYLSNALLSKNVPNFCRLP